MKGEFMNNEKRDLILKAADQFKGNWRGGATHIMWSERYGGIFSVFVENGEIGSYRETGDERIGINVSEWKPLCTHSEYESVLKELADNAPEGATHYGDYCYFKLDADVIFLWIYNSERWIKVKGIDLGEYIPLPKKPLFTVADDAAETNASEWNGEGLPPVGVRCRFWCTAREKECSDFVGTVKYMSSHTCVMDLGTYEFVAHPDTMKFSPLKTEAEKEKERVVNMACDKLSVSSPAPMNTDHYKNLLGQLYDNKMLVDPDK